VAFGRAAMMTASAYSATLIITRQGLGREARVWLTMHGSIRATAVLDDQQVSQLTSKLRTEPGTAE